MKKAKAFGIWIGGEVFSAGFVGLLTHLFFEMETVKVAVIITLIIGLPFFGIAAYLWYVVLIRTSPNYDTKKWSLEQCEANVWYQMEQWKIKQENENKVFKDALLAENKKTFKRLRYFAWYLYEFKILDTQKIDSVLNKPYPFNEWDNIDGTRNLHPESE